MDIGMFQCGSKTGINKISVMKWLNRVKQINVRKNTDRKT